MLISIQFLKVWL